MSNNTEMTNTIIMQIVGSCKKKDGVGNMRIQTLPKCQLEEKINKLLAVVMCYSPIEVM